MHSFIDSPIRSFARLLVRSCLGLAVCPPVFWCINWFINVKLKRLRPVFKKKKKSKFDHQTILSRKRKILRQADKRFGHQGRLLIGRESQVNIATVTFQDGFFLPFNLNSRKSSVTPIMFYEQLSYYYMQMEFFKWNSFLQNYFTSACSLTIQIEKFQREKKKCWYTKLISALNKAGR